MGLAIAVASKELEVRCLRLSREGKSYSQIADELGIKPRRVSQIIRRAFNRAEFASELEVDIQRKIVLGRLDEMISALYSQALGEEPRVVKLATTGEEIAVKSPSLEAIKVIRDLDKSRRELLGLDIAQKKDQAGNVQVVVSYVQNGAPAGAPTPAAEPAITVDYSEVKCLPEPEK